ncbi:toll/interleukin-1 receptor domain-containing protein [Variovorax sp. J22R115]|uniref:toll/interleukin-1 receptor domain-containing protein n=1 Tax=Variovorax sp. J22R115 TaxID=3053509 RepID=UPI00257747AE|nr:toll/interleukin-1 receptor domain-containing protein [Variovorax sp. J22R115]MDM0053904.1 toll/interleukin-1 receptor domain-containing protein [Variovorax sp. J22R115]
MFADAIKTIIDLLMLRKTEKKLDVEIKHGELSTQKTELEIAELKRRSAPPGLLVTPDQITLEIIQRVDPRSAANANAARQQIRAFVSYSHDRRLQAIELSEALRRGDVEAFLDTSTRVNGDFAGEEIVRAIDVSDVFVVLLSEGTFRSGWAVRELELARRVGKVVIPVYLDDFEPLLSGPDEEKFSWLRTLAGLRWPSTAEATPVNVTDNALTAPRQRVWD